MADEGDEQMLFSILSCSPSYGDVNNTVIMKKTKGV